MIEAQGLVRNYGDFVAVNDVSFSIPDRQIVGLLGHNGAGKTTILKMLTGVLEPTEGRILIDGLDIAENRLSAQKRTGYLPENCPLYPEMTVVEYLEHIAELRGLAPGSRLSAIKEVVEKTELQDKLKNPIGTLSKGYRQRVGVAQALVHKPEILILDEPTSGLDPSQINHMRYLVKKLSEYSTVILSTHVLQEVEAVCGRVIILSQGRIALDSPMNEIQTSNRLMIHLDGEPDDVRKSLQGVAGIRFITLIKRDEFNNCYLVEVEEGSENNPDIAKAVVDRGFKLFSLHSERRTLETVFREIHSGTAGGVNAD